MLSPFVTAVSRDGAHAFSKPGRDSIRLIAGLGVDGDAHAGRTVQHRSRVARDPRAPNLRQVHLIHAELHDELNLLGFGVAPGDMGENITTRGLDLLGLPGWLAADARAAGGGRGHRPAQPVHSARRVQARPDEGRA